MNARGGLIYIVAGVGLAYLWVTGNLAKVTDYLTRAAGGTPTGGAALQPTHPITLPLFLGKAARQATSGVPTRPSSGAIPAIHPGGTPAPAGTSA